MVLLIDHPLPGRGVTAPFFGRDVTIPAGAAWLARQSGAALVPAAALRADPWRYEARILADFSVDTTRTPDEQADLRRLTADALAIHERWIRRCPEQWYMFREMWPRHPREVR